MAEEILVLPRAGPVKASDTTIERIPAPSKVAFVETFGTLLPQASHLETPYGHAAYYELQPSSPAPNTTSIDRVLFVHGVQTSAIGLQPLASALQSRFPHAHRVLVDLWGHGLSDTPLLAHEPALFHPLLEALMVRLGWEDAHFIGYSFGTVLTTTFAVAKPARISSMALIAPAGFIPRAQFNDLQKSYLVGGNGLELAAREWILDWLNGGTLVVPQDWKERVHRGEVVAPAVKDWQMREHRGHAASVISIIRDGGVMDNQAAFAAAVGTGIPSICILGETDDLSSEQDVEGAGLRNIAVVPRAGHEVVRSAVPEVAELIDQFWKAL